MRVLGRLEGRGGFRRLTGACEIAPVQVDEAERDRLLKALQEHVEVAALFEEACGDGGEPAGTDFAAGGPGSVRSPSCVRSGMAPRPHFSQERPVSDVRVIIQRDSEREERVVTTGTTAAELFAGERSIIAARVAGELKDLAYEVQDGETVEGVEISSEDGLNILRHSTAHVMAQAVQELFPEAKLGIGPPVKDGFYYDFDVEKPFTPRISRPSRRRCRRSRSAASGSPAAW
ncbi:hypothetical protein STENM223S_04543 [Streptomyces tendae]